MFSVIEYIIEVVNWVIIVLSPTLIGEVIGLIIYGNYPNGGALEISPDSLFFAPCSLFYITLQSI